MPDMNIEEIASITAIPVLDTAAYAAGDRVGSVMPFAGAGDAPGHGGRIWAVRLVDRANQKVALNLWLFRNTPTIASADNAALDITDANLDLSEPLGFVAFATTDYVDTASNAFAQRLLPDPGLPYITAGNGGVVGASGTIFGLLEAGTAAAPTYAANSLTVTLICELA